MLMTTILAGALAAASVVATPKLMEEKPGLAAQARITPEQATKTAQAKAAGGTLKSFEIENEDGKLIYSFDFVRKGATGVDEIAVDAISGALVKSEHETPAMEAKERAADVKKAKADREEAGEKGEADE